MRTYARLCISGTLLIGVVLPTAVSAQIRDTSKIRQTPAGWVLDFQQQPLRVVINALAEAGGLNVATANIPNRNIDLRMGQGLDRAGIIDVLKGIALSNNLQLYESSSLIRVEGPTPPPEGLTSAQQRAAQQLQAAQNVPQLYTYRLRHASAVQLAPVLMSLFQGIRQSSISATGLPTNIQFNIPGQGGGGVSELLSLGGDGAITRIMGDVIESRAAAAGASASGNVVIQQRGGAQRGGAQQGGAQQSGVQQAQQGGRGNAGGGGAQQAGRGAQQAARSAIAQQLAQQMQSRAGGGGLSSTASDVRIVAEESSNSLLIRASEQDFQLVQQILATVDLRPLQVLIEVTIAEVTRSEDLNVGIAANVERTPKGKTAADATATLPANAGARDFVLQLTGGKGTIDFNVALNALATRGDLKVLSMPVIIAQNNREAILNVGSSRPFVQVTQAGGIDPSARVQTIQYIDVGTVLTITPTINPDGYVNLLVSQTANSATNEVQFDAPVISKREATTQVFVRDGQTTVIGGLADNSNSVTKSGVPLLRDIPLLGWLFRGTQQSKTTSELYLFLTPHVVTSDSDIERLRDAIKDGSELLKNVPINGRIPPKTDTLDVPPAVRPPVVRPPVIPPQ